MVLDLIQRIILTNGMPVNPDLSYRTYLANVVDSTLSEITDTVVVGENSMSINSIINNPLCFEIQQI